MTHGGQELDVHDVGELPGLLQVVEARLLHQLTHNLVGDLRKKEEEGVTAIQTQNTADTRNTTVIKYVCFLPIDIVA